MIVTDRLHTGIGDIEGTISVGPISNADATDCLCAEWNRLKSEGFGGVGIAVSSEPVPDFEEGGVSINGTYQLMEFLERALERAGLSTCVEFVFVPAPPPERERTGWEAISISLGRDLGLRAACLDRLTRLMEISRRRPEFVEPAQEYVANLSLTSPSPWEFVLHSRERQRLQQMFDTRDLRIELNHRLLDTEEVEAHQLRVDLHEPG